MILQLNRITGFLTFIDKFYKEGAVANWKTGIFIIQHRRRNAITEIKAAHLHVRLPYQTTNDIAIEPNYGLYRIMQEKI